MFGREALLITRQAVFQPNATPEKSLQFAFKIAAMGGLDNRLLARAHADAVERREAMSTDEYTEGTRRAAAASGRRSGAARRARSAERDAWIIAQETAKAAWRGLQAAGVELSYSTVKRIRRRPADVHAADVERCRAMARKPVIMMSARPTPQQIRLRRKYRHRYEFRAAPPPSVDPYLEALRSRRAREAEAAYMASPAYLAAEAARREFEAQERERAAAAAREREERERAAALAKEVARAAAAQAERIQCGAIIRAPDGGPAARCAELKAEGLPHCAAHALNFLRGATQCAPTPAAALLYSKAAQAAEAGDIRAAAALYAQAQAAPPPAPESAPPPAPPPAPAPAPAFPDFRAYRARVDAAMAAAQAARDAAPPPAYFPKFCHRCQGFCAGACARRGE